MEKSKALLFASLAVASSGLAHAQSIPAPGKLTLGGDVKVHTYVDSSFQYNFNRTPVSSDTATSSQNTYRFNDRGHHQFQLNQARVGLSHDANPIGFDVQLGFGTVFDALNQYDGAANRTFSAVRRATMSYHKSGFLVDLGRMDAGHGLERIDSVDNMNYSRSFAFSLMQAKLLNGLALGYSANEFTVAAGVANGVDRVDDNNRGKTYLVKLAHDAAKSHVGLNYFVGSERASDSTKWRHSVNLNGTYKVTDMVTLGADANGVFGRDEILNAAGTSASARRYGLAGYGACKFVTDHQDALRVEWFHDEKGAATQTNKALTFVSTTLTHRWMISQNFSAWAEARWDWASKEAFAGKGGDVSRENQVTGLVAGTFHL